MRRRLLSLALAAPLAGVALAPVPALAAGAPTCAGVRATIVVTSASPHVVVGTPRRDVVLVRAAGHELRTGAGDDLICGSSGRDVIDGGAGNDVVRASSGDDTVRGGAGRDVLSGEDGADRLSGDDGDDTLLGGAGDDTLTGGGGNDALDGGRGRDHGDGGPGRNVLRHDAADDAPSAGETGHGSHHGGADDPAGHDADDD